jgi:hypothetical protein
MVADVGVCDDHRNCLYSGVKSCEYIPCSRCCLSESSFSTHRCIARTQQVLAALMECWRENLMGIWIDVYMIVQRLYVKTLYGTIRTARRD